MVTYELALNINDSHRKAVIALLIHSNPHKNIMFKPIDTFKMSKRQFF